MDGNQRPEAATGSVVSSLFVQAQQQQQQQQRRGGESSSRKEDHEGFYTHNSNSSGMPQVHLKGPGRTNGSAGGANMGGSTASGSSAGDRGTAQEHIGANFSSINANVGASLSQRLDIGLSGSNTYSCSKAARNGASAGLPQQQQQQHADPTQDSSASAEVSAQPGAADGPHVAATTAVLSTSTATSSSILTRPAFALSMRLEDVYQDIHTRLYVQRRAQLPGAKHNGGYDDVAGHYVPIIGEDICGRYRVLEKLGSGSFGLVLRCYDLQRKIMVALKIARRMDKCRRQAKAEACFLMELNANPALQAVVVHLLKVVNWQEHMILVFELLSFNLYRLIECTRFQGVSLDLVRRFAHQLIFTLLQLEKHKPYPIVHCDIKPENIVLRTPSQSGVRLIDFGISCYTNECVHSYIQSRFYRAPEVILQIGYGTAIDRWSLACVLVELHTGMPLFRSKNEASHLAKFEAILGPLPADMIARSPKLDRFYYRSIDGSGTFRLRDGADTPAQSLESVIGVTTGGPGGRRANTKGHSEEAYREFHDFISRLLKYRPEDRMTCAQAMNHPFLKQLLLEKWKNGERNGA